MPETSTWFPKHPNPAPRFKDHLVARILLVFGSNHFSHYALCTSGDCAKKAVRGGDMLSWHEFCWKCAAEKL